MQRLALIASHPVQYYVPLFRELARRIDLHVFYAHDATAAQQAAAGFGHAFTWDIDLKSGYSYSFLRNVAKNAGTDRFSGCDTPEIGARLREGSFTAVLALGWHLKSMIQGILAAKRIGLPVLVRGDSQLGTPRSRLKRITKSVVYPRFLRLFNAALYVGERNRDYYRFYNYPENSLFHSPHCVDTARFAASATAEARSSLRIRLGLSDADRLVLFAGKLLPFKRPLDVVEAVALLRASGVPTQLMVAGSGPLDSDLRALALSRNVPLHSLGFQNQTEMPAAYVAADLLCLPSTARETWGLVCNEALACGTPAVMSSEVGCAPDLASPGSVCQVFPIGNVTELANAMSKVLADPDGRERAALLSEHFTLARAADGIVSAMAYASRTQSSDAAERNFIR